ncbi:putative metallopeptidase [Tundrisphaera lichenicola]|uniref:putative metallopeptidase n=1 Tax=Tundrisphaera lichenicola TaxID=2029860 RepID=UPI003EBEBFA3
MATYGFASKDVQAMIDGLISDNHPDLVETAARVEALFAYPVRNKYGAEKSPAVSQFGVGCLGKVKVNSEADRVEGKPDATITIDQPAWEKLETPERKALIDRFLYALVVRKKKGEILTDDQGRPKLKVRKPDWLLSGYRAMAERHKEHAAEVIQARQFRDDFGQLLFGFAEGGAIQEQLPGVEAGARKPRKPRGAAVVAAANR